MEITYLLNSGFLIRDAGILLVFDDYADPRQEVKKALESDFDKLYIFASHAHFDHFSLEILQFSNLIEHYIFSYDIRRTKRAKSFPLNKVVYLKPYENWNDPYINVQSFSSTDIGVSYLVILPSGKKIFHAGDFNYWYWSGDGDNNRRQAKIDFENQMNKLDGLDADIAFFPIDGRLGEYKELGAREFFRRTNIRAMIGMHNVGFNPWIPNRDFFGNKNPIFTWSPSQPGDSKIF